MAMPCGLWKRSGGSAAYQEYYAAPGLYEMDHLIRLSSPIFDSWEAFQNDYKRMEPAAGG